MGKGRKDKMAERELRAAHISSPGLMAMSGSKPVIASAPPDVAHRLRLFLFWMYTNHETSARGVVGRRPTHDTAFIATADTARAFSSEIVQAAARKKYASE